MKFAPVILSAAVVVAPFAALAQSNGLPAAQSMAAPTATKATNGDKVICKSEQEPGSLIAKKKVCMTASQWRDQQFRSGQWAEQMSTYNSQPNGR